MQYLDLYPLMFMITGLPAEATYRWTKAVGRRICSTTFGTLPLGLLFNNLWPLMLVIGRFSTKTAYWRTQTLCGLRGAALAALPFYACHNTTPYYTYSTVSTTSSCFTATQLEQTLPLLTFPQLHVHASPLSIAWFCVLVYGCPDIFKSRHNAEIVLFVKANNPSDNFPNKPNIQKRAAIG